MFWDFVIKLGKGFAVLRQAFRKSETFPQFCGKLFGNPETSSQFCDKLSENRELSRSFATNLPKIGSRLAVLRQAFRKSGASPQFCNALLCNNQRLSQVFDRFSAYKK